MDLDRVKAIVTYYDQALTSRWYLEAQPRPHAPVVRASNLPHPALCHVRYMIAALLPMIEEGRTEKCMRWLGFIQGVLWMAGVFTLEELKNHSRPDFPPPTLESNPL